MTIIDRRTFKVNINHWLLYILCFSVLKNYPLILSTCYFCRPLVPRCTWFLTVTVQLTTNEFTSSFPLPCNISRQYQPKKIFRLAPAARMGYPAQEVSNKKNYAHEETALTLITDAEKWYLPATTGQVSSQAQTGYGYPSTSVPITDIANPLNQNNQGECFLTIELNNVNQDCQIICTKRSSWGLTIQLFTLVSSWIEIYSQSVF